MSKTNTWQGYWWLDNEQDKGHPEPLGHRSHEHHEIPKQKHPNACGEKGWGTTESLFPNPEQNHGGLSFVPSLLPTQLRAEALLRGAFPTGPELRLRPVAEDRAWNSPESEKTVGEAANNNKRIGEQIRMQWHSLCAISGSVINTCDLMGW